MKKKRNSYGAEFKQEAVPWTLTATANAVYRGG